MRVQYLRRSGRTLCQSLFACSQQGLSNVNTPYSPPLSSRARAWLLAWCVLAVAPLPSAAQLVRGQVEDSLSGAAVSQSTVVLADSTGAEADRTVSDAGGYYLLRAPQPGRYQLIVEHEAYRRSVFPPFDLAAEMRSFVLRVAPRESVSDGPVGASDATAGELCPDGTDEEHRSIVGIVRDGASGRPVPGARVHFSLPAEGTGAVPTQIRAVETDQRGAYAVCHAPVLTRIAVHAVAGDRMSTFEAMLFGTGGVFHRGAFQPMSGSVWRQDLELISPNARGAVLTGTVTDTSGAAVSGATVEIVGTPHRTRTDRTGHFAFSDLAHGDVRVQAKQVGYAPAEFDVELSAGETMRIPDDVLTLGQFPTRLRDIIVRGEAAAYYDPRLDGFFLRRETSAGGKFATRDEWQKWLHFNLSDIIHRMRIGFDAVPSCRQPASAFVDGVYVPPSMSAAAFMDLDQLVAIEAYGNGFDAPPQYRRHFCGSVILYWTRR
jgi:hypothetical protein